MNSFDDAVERRLRAQQQSTDAETAERAAKAQACAAAAAEMSRLLGQLADYLNRHSQPRAIEIRGRAKWYKQPTMSPQGHVLSDSRAGGDRRVQMLLPNGQLWEYFSALGGVPDGAVCDLRAVFDDPHMSSRSGSVTIGKFLFSADLSSGALCASTKNYDGETYRDVDPSEALAEIAANFRTS
ncbi:hypothetical protein ACIGO9_15150 [Nocardia asteroides]|uniref:hypothetical protein n=1 Tax=Nocardia asteroides TaxID=1824 RepID=UPI0037CAACC0